MGRTADERRHAEAERQRDLNVVGARAESRADGHARPAPDQYEEEDAHSLGDGVAPEVRFAHVDKIRLHHAQAEWPHHALAEWPLYN